MTVAGAAGVAWAKLADVDPELWAAMVGERDRQHWKIELIASENYTFAAVMEAQGSWLTNKYAEGLPGKRYYGGCEFVDVVERLAQRARPRAVPRRRARQRPAARGRPGELRGVLRGPRSGRRRDGPQPLARRPSHARDGAQLLGSAVRGPSVRRRPVDRALRLRRDRAASRATSGPKMIVTGATAYPADHRLRAPRPRSPTRSTRCCSRTWPTSRASWRPASTRAPFRHADIVTTTTHKTLRGPRGGLIFSRQRPARGHRPEPVPAGQDDARRGDRSRRVPRPPGRPADARDRRQGGRAPPGGDGRLPDATSTARSRTQQPSRRRSRRRARA